MNTGGGTAAGCSVPPLQDSELRYRHLFEAAQDGILILDAEMTVNLRAPLA